MTQTTRPPPASKKWLRISGGLIRLPTSRCCCIPPRESQTASSTNPPPAVTIQEINAAHSIARSSSRVGPPRRALFPPVTLVTLTSSSPVRIARRSGRLPHRRSPGDSQGPGTEGDAGKDERKAAERGRGDRLVEERGAVTERQRGDEIGDESSVRRSGARDEGEVEQVRHRETGCAECQHGPDRLPAWHVVGQLRCAERQHRHGRDDERAE